MGKFNVFIDGTWLFRICKATGILAAKTENPNEHFRIDFEKLTKFIERQLGQFYGRPFEPAELMLFTSIIDVSKADPSWGDLTRISNGSYARSQFVYSASQAGYDVSNVFSIPLKQWMIRAIENDTYEEKMVDTTLVATLVERTIKNPNFVQVIIAGDLDILPGIKTVIPNYSENVVLVSSHPEQFDINNQTSSFHLHSFEFKYGPIYLENYLIDIMVGNYTYKCHHCGKVFARWREIPRHHNPLCGKCLTERNARSS
ncbi:zinc ribbon domain-containing protein [Alicyclobacillus macrosporangiidus]|uniref:C2H2-type domain-containing protein n=1 Tax=Alicyclobacillus macrosporangiidus TaxID=392015 RepID=A0A1I7FUY4_9BACL|nr:zinc ribbon domain-containing protein [Alicyclobacillus macrosporangiidus]SFU40005.1 hypothetical protein SAMN05421543_101466 [Alicyclobacillus macrosporangiidus]